MPCTRWSASIVAAVAMAVAATGCAAAAKDKGATQSQPATAAATAAAAAPAAVPHAATAADPDAVLVPAPATSAPRCRPLVRYAAGNAGPLFCTDGRDSPAALHYFTSLNLKILQLPSGATQAQAVAMICADMHRVSEGAEYSAYLLAANREHWYFTGIAKIHGALHLLCTPATPST